jgi:parallel beta-helix repeat protein
LDDVDITNNDITGCDGDADGIFIGEGNGDIDIVGNNISTNEGSGIHLGGGFDILACDNIRIEDNTISSNELHGIFVDSSVAPTKLQILENDIMDNEEDGIQIENWTKDSDIIMFNSITGNDEDSLDTNEDVIAILNWWGTTVTSEIEDEFDGGGTITYKPILNAPREAVISGSKVATDAASLDAKTAANVKVSGAQDAAGVKADIIGAAGYVSNPEEELAGVIAFFDVYIELDNNFVVDDDTKITVKFYDSAITGNSRAYFWTGDFWVECSDQLARDGVVYVYVSEDSVPAPDELEDTPFAILSGPPVSGVVEGELAAPVILAPQGGATNLPIRPTFMWERVVGAKTYDLQIADNYLFHNVIEDRTELSATVYSASTDLDYGTAYYWRVRGIKPAVLEAMKAVLEEEVQSAWSTGVFTTEAAPEVVVPPAEVWVSPYTGQKFGTEAELLAHVAAWEAAHPEPPTVPPTPGYIWAVIVIGAVLVIAVIILIVRTRRVV